MCKSTFVTPDMAGNYAYIARKAPGMLTKDLRQFYADSNMSPSFYEVNLPSAATPIDILIPGMTLDIVGIFTVRLLTTVPSAVGTNGIFVVAQNIGTSPDIGANLLLTTAEAPTSLFSYAGGIPMIFTNLRVQLYTPIAGTVNLQFFGAIFNL